MKTRRNIRSSTDVVAAERGGMKESGIGRENGLEAFEACESLLGLSAFGIGVMTG